MNQLLSIKTSAARLSVSPWTIRAWVTQGRIASVKLGSRRLIPESEIDRIISEGSVSATDKKKNDSTADSSAEKVIS